MVRIQKNEAYSPIQESQTVGLQEEEILDNLEGEEYEEEEEAEEQVIGSPK